MIKSWLYHGKDEPLNCIYELFHTHNAFPGSVLCIFGKISQESCVAFDWDMIKLGRIEKFQDHSCWLVDIKCHAHACWFSVFCLLLVVVTVGLTSLVYAANKTNLTHLLVSILFAKSGSFCYFFKHKKWLYWYYIIIEGKEKGAKIKRGNN